MKTRIGFGVLGILAVATIAVLSVMLYKSNAALAQSEAEVAQLKTTIAAPIQLALEPINGVQRVWGYDTKVQQFRFYDPALLDISDLKALTPGQGYWVNVGSNQTVELCGTPYTLVAGWNLIGWKGGQCVGQ